MSSKLATQLLKEVSLNPQFTQGREIPIVINTYINILVTQLSLLQRIIYETDKMLMSTVKISLTVSSILTKFREKR